MKVYFISGLAADSRVFKYIQLPAGFEKICLEWIDPLPAESLEAYACRLSAQMDMHEPFIVAGLSMGGMIATEIANRFDAAACILFCSIPTAGHLPAYYHWAARMRLHLAVPVSLLKKISMLKRDFSPDSNDDKQLLRQVIADSDPRFIRWALQAILHWRNDRVPKNLFHVHGNKDGILPIRYLKPTHVIHGGNHMMIMSRAGEINAFLAAALSKVALMPAASS